MKVAALGRTQWLYESIRVLAERGHEIVLIGTCPAAAEYSVGETDFARLAEEFGSAFFCDPTIDPRCLRMLQESGAEVAISVNWLTLVSQEILDQFKHGVINAHAGDLPRFRGNAVASWAILSGEKRVVLTLHQMSAALDAGPILLQRACPLTPDTYVGDVYHFLAENIPSMFAEVLDGIAAETLTPREQQEDLSVSLRCFPRIPRDGEIDWDSPAEYLARQVRASGEPFAGAYSFLGSEKVTIWRAHAEPLLYAFFGVPGQVVQLRPRAGQVAILAKDGVLVLEEMETATRGRVRAIDLIKSTRVRLGLDLSQEIIVLSRRVAELESELAQLSRASSKQD